jgi:tetratricopeptide (TPR) repeat protein
MGRLFITTRSHPADMDLSGEEPVPSYTPSAALPPDVLARPDVREAIETHDFGRLFLLTRRWARISYSKIAESTGIKPERVGSLARGSGSITSYAKIAEISDGLRIPGHLLGLTPRPWENLHSDTISTARRFSACASDEQSEVRSLLSHAATVTMGVGDPGPMNARWHAPAEEMTPPPHRVGLDDVTQIERITAQLRALDYQYGGGACRDAVVAQTRWVARLLDADAAEETRRRLHLTLADLHNLAGWTSLDVGMYSAARRHFAHALSQSRRADAPSLMANVLYRTGRLHLHRSMTREALRFFQLGQIAAQDSGDATAVAVLCANEAWAYGYLGDPAQALRSLNRAADELGRAEPSSAAPWAAFFGMVDLDAMTGVTHLELSTVENSHLPPARTALTKALRARGEQMARSRAFETTALAVACLRDHDEDVGLALGWQAVTMAEHLRSGRVVDRLGPLATQASESGSGHAADLVRHIESLRLG